jgi:ribosome-associated translation inhibitor RaiA
MAIQTDVTFHGVEASTSLERFAREWVARLVKVYDRIEHCNVTIELPHRHHARGRAWHVRVSVAIPGRTLVVSHDPQAEGEESPYAAVSHAFRTAKRQLEHHVHAMRDDRRHATV